MSVDSYREVLEKSKLTLIAAHLRDYLTCPIAWNAKKQMKPIIPILLEKWFYTVTDLLTPGEVHPNYLADCHGYGYLNAPSEENYEWAELLKPENENNEGLLYESRRMAAILFLMKDEIRNKYISSCVHLFNARALTEKDYPKHYVTGAKNCEEVRQLSLHPSNSDIGLLLPSLSCEIQEYALWLGFSLLFERKMNSALDADPTCSKRDAFEIAWNDTLGNLKSSGFVLNCLTTVGAYNGQLANNLVLDLSLHSNEFHCYPATVTNDSLPCVTADDLQGLASYFDTGRQFGLSLFVD